MDFVLNVEVVVAKMLSVNIISVLTSYDTILHMSWFLILDKIF